MNIKKISKREAQRLIVDYHYSKVLPKLNKLFLGGFINDDLVAVMTLGWGVRPLHTIRKLFPSLSSKDYWEIGKMCIIDEMPKNTESHFISECIKYVQKHYQKIKLIYTWADGMLGKPGYVYQASNFLYGGFIWTDTYFTNRGEKVHPRTTGKIGGRPSRAKQKELGFTQYKGKQFRYVYFICSKKDKKKLLRETTVDWSLNPPKQKDLEWKKYNGEKWVLCKRPFYDNTIASFNDNAVKNIKWVKDNKPLKNFIAEEVSREKHQLSKLKGLGQYQHSAFTQNTENT